MAVQFWRRFFQLHHMNDCDDLNFYYQKFLTKLSKISLKIFLPLLSLIYLFPLFLCRLLFFSTRFDIRTNLFLLFAFLTFILLVLVRLHTKWNRLWICTRLTLLLLLLAPLVLTYTTEQFHILFSTLSIILIYSFLTFTLLQSFFISLTISILHLLLLLNDRRTSIQWQSLEFLSIIFYHLIIHLTGLYSYVSSIKHIREHFYTYRSNLFEKNQFNVDCKKLNTIISYYQQASSIVYNNSLANVGTVINCSISLNEQTRIHTCEEFASFIDILFCQIEQLIIKNHPKAHYLFDTENITITILNDDDNESSHVDHSCRLAIDLTRFIQYVKQITQWNLRMNVGIDYNEVRIISADWIEGAAYDQSKCLREQCSIDNRIVVSSKIYEMLKDNAFYRFSLLSKSPSTYFLSTDTISPSLEKTFLSMNISDMIDQLTRIQAEYYVEKHLGTITLTPAFRKRSLFELTSKYIHWFSLNFKDKSLTTDYQSQQHSKHFLYIFLVVILIGCLLQSWVINRCPIIYLILFPLIVLGLVLLIIVFHRSVKPNVNQRFFTYLNVLICLTLSTFIFVAIEYYSIQNWKYLFVSNNQTSVTNRSVSFRQHSDNLSLSFNRQYHDYLILLPLYPLYFCTLYRPCSWIIKSLFILVCSILQLYIFEYIWFTTNKSFLAINTLHHYTTLTLIILHNLLLVLLSYVHEWLEKIDFIWLKQIDHERLIIIEQRNDLIERISSFLPTRVINYYLDCNANRSLTQHYHHRYEQMGLLYIRLNEVDDREHFSELVEQIFKSNEQYLNIVIHRRSTNKEILFSLDLNTSLQAIQQLVELLFQINEQSTHLTACLHIGYINEILVHFAKSPKIDVWSEHLSLIEVLLSKIPDNHCLVTSSVYHLLNDLYLFRTAGSMVNMENHTTLYFLLGRLIGENVFQGRNALPLIVNQSFRETIRKSSSTDHSQFSQHRIEKNLSSTTSSSGVFNDQQSLLKHARLSNQSSYRHTLLQALNPMPTHGHQIHAKRRLSKIIHLAGDKNCWSTKERKCSMLTQKPDQSKRTDENIHGHVYDEPSTKDLLHPSRSFSIANEETTSSFSGWDDIPSSSALLNNDKQQELISLPTVSNGYYPSHPCDLAFTVNMKTTQSPVPRQEERLENNRPKQFNLARKLIAETSESEMSIPREPWTRNIAYRSRDLLRTSRLSSSYNNLSKLNAQLPSICPPDLLQRWLEEQLNQFRSQTKQSTPPLVTKQTIRFSTIANDSTDEESDTLHENTFPILKSQTVKRPYKQIRYKPLRKNTRHQSLKYKTNPFVFDDVNPLPPPSKRTDSSSIPRSDLSDICSSRPDNLSEGVPSNLGSEYDNMYTNGFHSNRPTTNNNTSQILTDEEDSDDDTTLATTVNRCYF